MGMGLAPTWLRQVSPPASRDHFNHCHSSFITRALDDHCGTCSHSCQPAVSCELV